MSLEANTIQHFYQRFAALDAEAMAACYAEDAEFEDPAFSLRGRREIGGMWAMLCTAVADKGRDAWSLQASQIRSEGQHGFAHWEPHYRFSATGRLVHNIIDAEFEFKDGLIVRHRDQFDFYRWSRQALGTPGLLLGWSSFLRNKVRKQARANLDAFLAKR